MDSIDLHLSDDLARFVEEQAAAGGHASREAYVEKLVRAEWAKERLRALIQEGLDSPLAGPADESYFEELRELARIHARK